MGGINCAGGNGGASASAQFLEEYTKQLASYCRALFDGSAKFFDANIAIEDSIISDGALSEAIQFLGASEKALSEAKNRIGTVATLWSYISEPIVDFSEQQKLIAEAADKVSVARMDLQALVVGDSLQQSLWRDPALTSNFVAALDSLIKTTVWQAKFAQMFAPANLMTA